MNENNLLLLNEGATMTKTFREQKENILADDYKNKGVLPTCETFDRQAFDTLLSNKDIKSVRIYSCMDDKLQVRFIIVGVNDNDEDVYIDDDQQTQQYVIEVGLRCPESCPPSSVLNG